ncbi:hypothetical protein E3T35_03490 [Cryobacterium sp. TMT1-2-2]|uniref:hypothetical protein n=1 Tax=Cryobacterium sp. TMT1-2-2 TaxID=1259233 RepID=UPI00106A5FFE|nr:hypothetical protein [Cryobacterium sp. TMT1-2-2]TFD14462.1 hypothetical protein E3T35_03490 [Cryobacterium sp. TMT1-2-2]
MATRQTGKKIDARERARLARTRVDQVRAERDNKIEATLAEFFTAGDERDALIAKIDALETTMGERVTSLFEFGESASRVADLTALSPKEVKRMRTFAASRQTPLVTAPPRI